MANGSQLPSGFVLDQPEQPSGLPEGFVMDEPADQPVLSVQPAAEQEEPSPTALVDPVQSMESELASQKGGLEALTTIVSGAVAEPFAGIAGLVSLPFVGSEKAEDIIESVREGMTILPESETGKESLAAVGETLKPLSEAFSTAESTLGDAVLEATGSKEMAAIAHTIPTATLELLGVGIGRRAVKVAETATKKSQAAVDAVKDARAGKVTDEGTQNIVDTIQKGTPDEVADIINADPEFFRAADELGVNTEPLASFASRNPQFRDVEGALRKVPGSILEPQAIKFIEETSQAADNLIQRYGGTLDKAQLGLDFKREALTNIDDLAAQADNVYDTIRELIPETNRFEAPETVAFLADLAKKEKIPPRLARILNDLKPKTVDVKSGEIVDITGEALIPTKTRSIPPTLGKIDQIRKEVGQAIGRGSGPFKDVETGLNKALYARLTKDQDAIAASIPGGASITDAAKGLIRQRKQLEDNLQVLLGKDLNKALNVSVAGAIKNLQKGEIDRFNEVMNSIPKHRRGEVALSAMNDVFKGTGVNQQGLSPTQFTKWYQTINRSPAVRKALFDVLPVGSKRAIDNLFQVSRGISRALGQTTPTGRINALFNPETGIIRKMIGKTAASAVAFSTGSPVASVATGVTMDFLRQTTDGAKRAADLMGSPQFQNIVRNSVKEGVADGAKASDALLKAEAALSKSKQFKAWADALGKDDRAALQGGLISYLFQEQEQQ